jgi:hypothetical protein
MSMPLMPPEDAQSLTGPFHEWMHDAHRQAMERWVEFVTEKPDLTRPLRPPEKYAFLHRHIADHLASETKKGATYSESLGFSALLLSSGDGLALVRFKHLNSDLSHRVYPTNQQRHLGRQQYTGSMMEQLALEGIDAPPTVLTLGYMESPAGNEMARVLIVCRTPKLYYHYDVLPGAEGTGTSHVVQPFPGQEPSAPRVLSTREEKKRTGDGAD